MELTRRFVFRGNAAALSGQIFRPQTIIVDLDGASSLGVSGGRSQSQIKGRSFGDIIKFGSAFTVAEGLFDDEKRASEVTDHKGTQDQLTSTTTVTAEIRELSVGRKPIFFAKRIRATLVSKSPNGSGEPRIAPARDTVIQGVTIGGRGLTVTLDLGVFQKYNTRSKLVAATDDPKFVSGYSHTLLMRKPIKGDVARNTPRLITTSSGAIHTTIVKEIRWDDKPFPGARIDDNAVIVPDLGTLFFGEMLITGYERRLTMVRFDLGSPDGGWGDTVDVGSNGVWSP
jgi:hypothetical protein